MTSRFARIFVFALAFAFAATLMPTPMQAGTVILEGSDAIGFHCALGDAGACTYMSQVWTALEGPSSLPIAVIGTNVTSSATGSGTSGVTIDSFATVAAAGSLSSYAAVYFLAGAGCCTEDDSTIGAPGAAAAVSAYLASGGTVMIENYTGGSVWDFAVGTSGGGNGHVGGVGGGLPGPGCDDGETVTATGIANGFTQPPPLGCWTHQGYDQSFFGPLGFTLSFFDSPPAYTADNPGVGPWSSLLSNGVTKTGATPEPATFALLGAGLTGLALLRRRQTRKPDTK